MVCQTGFVTVQSAYLWTVLNGLVYPLGAADLLSRQYNFVPIQQSGLGDADIRQSYQLPLASVVAVTCHDDHSR